MRSERLCFLLLGARACWKNVSLENNALSDEDTNSKNTRTKRSSFVRKRVRDVTHVSTLRPENKFPVLHKVKFRVFGVRPDLGFKSDIRLPQNIQLSLTHRERERLNPSFVASQNTRIRCFSYHKHRLNILCKAKHLNNNIQNVIG